MKEFRVRIERPGTEPVEVVLSAKDANEAYTAAEQMSIELLGDIYKIEIEDTYQDLLKRKRK